MSTFGSPGGRSAISKPTPPERGSFPLDHDAECQPLMKRYLACLRGHRGVNDDECRLLSKAYLQCRMDRNLMAPDSMRNLGFRDSESSTQTSGEALHTTARSPSSSPSSSSSSSSPSSSSASNK